MHRVWRLLAPAFAIFCVATTSYAKDKSCAGVDQEASLRAVYYSKGEMPIDPSTAEIDALQQLPPDAKKFLTHAFGNNKRLQAFAVRDRDGDGITDYRIGICGEFRENDPDVDCDGIANVLDSQPYDGVANSSTGSCAREPDWRKVSDDHNHNGLPDKIEWHRAGSSADEKQAAKVQEDLYRDFGIVLVNRRAQMPADLAIQIDHVIRQIFRGSILPDFAPLRVIAADLPVCGDDDFYGWTSPENSTVSVMQATIDLSPILRLEVLVHELTHTLQYSMDFSPADLDGFRKENRWNPIGFHAFAEKLEWEATPNPSSPGPVPAVGHCNPIYPFDLAYQGEKPKAGEDDLQYKWDDFNETGRAARHMASRYALADPFEWDAEYRAAFVLNKILDAAERLCDSSEVKALAKKFHADIAKQKWDYVNENARGLPSYENEISDQFSVDDATWDKLAREFLFKSYEGVCTE